MTQDDMRRWAAIGAEQRLVQLAEEAAAIYAAFPELRDRKQRSRLNALTGTASSSGRSEASAAMARPRRRRRLSPEARKRISDAQKARWARHRKAAAAR
ncbi:MAG TPA: hypothetical protein VL484_14545 [Vicinamibacterales bacterium]|jgi:hypothetical protein|nr:hypothetical protein [Vicinamibacterales bacterium]